MRIVFYILLIAMFACLGIYLSGPTRTSTLRIDAVSGSTQQLTGAFFGSAVSEVVTPSPLEVRLCEAGIAWTPDWRVLGQSERNSFGVLVSRGCGIAPEIHQIVPVLEGYARVANEDELRQFVNVLQTGSDDQQRAAVKHAGEIGLRAMFDDHDADCASTRPTR
jgi:hypothetical protein